MNLTSPQSEVSDSTSSPNTSPPDNPPQRFNPSFVAAFTSTFVTIFLAEMGDKTQVTTLLMTAQSHAPWIVFLGAATALISTSLVGVLVGRWLARRLSPDTLNTAAGVILLCVAIAQIWDLAHL